MGLLPFFFGFIIAVPCATLILKVAKGRFFIIDNPYFAGVLYGFWLWALLTLGFYLDLRFDILGFANAEQGLGLLSVITSSLRGFLIGGLAGALIWKKLLRR